MRFQVGFDGALGSADAGSLRACKRHPAFMEIDPDTKDVKIWADKNVCPTVKVVAAAQGHYSDPAHGAELRVTARGALA